MLVAMEGLMSFAHRSCGCTAVYSICWDKKKHVNVGLCHLRRAKVGLRDGMDSGGC